jgi:hypothetical protein
MEYPSLGVSPVPVDGVGDVFVSSWIAELDWVMPTEPHYNEHQSYALQY